MTVLDCPQVHESSKSDKYEDTWGFSGSAASCWVSIWSALECFSDLLSLAWLIRNFHKSPRTHRSSALSNRPYDGAPRCRFLCHWFLYRSLGDGSHAKTRPFVNMKYMNPFIHFLVPHPWCQFRLFHDVTSPFLCFYLVFVSPYGSLWIYDGLTWLPRRPSSPPVNLVSAVADAWQEIRRFVLNDLVTLVRERHGKRPKPKSKTFAISFLQFNMQDLQKFIEDWDVIRGKGGAGLFEKEHANKNPKDEKKESPNPQRISRTQIRHTFRVRLPASSFRLSWRTTVSQFRWHPDIHSSFLIIDCQILERQRWQVPQTFCPFKRGGAVTFQHCGFGVVLKQQALGTHIRIIGPEEQRLEPTMSQRSRVIPHANTNLVSFSHRFIFRARDGI